MRWMENSHDSSSCIESYSPRLKMPDTDNKPQGPLDVIGVGSSYCYQIPNFSIKTVELRNIRVSSNLLTQDILLPWEA